ncbi:MAG: FHA domain-containing protein [Calditrichia bacterium]
MSNPIEILNNGEIKLKEPVVLPHVLDMLIVGGGPAGTAAAFRAKELGLSALVIDFDDILRRIRDYAKEKPILPNYGGTDNVRFPKGGKLFSKLHFSPIDKDQMHQRWKRYYHEYSVPARIGIELISLARCDDHIWEAQIKNHNTQSEEVLLARHVVIGIGKGFPRRFDIPGNSDGIIHRLSDAKLYVDAPVCVIGGGTSAAEAVIAISNAKSRAGNSTAVYWSYRGAKMPRVSAALSEVFFEAYMQNGNIRYYPGSEPVAVVTSREKGDYLSVQVDRREIPGRPVEATSLQFPKDKVIACIGEDLPTSFLDGLGIHMIAGGEKNKKRMVVTPFLETQQENVFLIGDILSQIYLETSNFNADPASFKEVKHRGNIKSALKDGFLVAEAVSQKIKGVDKIHVQIRYADATENPPGNTTLISRMGNGIPSSATERNIGTDFSGTSIESGAYLMRCLHDDLEGESFKLSRNTPMTIGRKQSDICFPQDMLLSDTHASIEYKNSRYILTDTNSSNGVFFKAAGGKTLEIKTGCLIRIGKQFLQLQRVKEKFALLHYDINGNRKNEFQLPDKTIVLGREAPDVSLDSEDMMLSRRHLAVLTKKDKVFIRDLKGLNGTYVKVDEPLELKSGDCFRVGKQVLQFISVAEKVSISGSEVPPVSDSLQLNDISESSVAATQENTSIGELTITFKNSGKVLPFQKGQSICEVAEKNGIEITAECHSGSCGSDPIRIVSGLEHIVPPEDSEITTIEDICELEAGKCRMSCMVRPCGPVVVEVLKP